MAGNGFQRGFGKTVVRAALLSGVLAIAGCASGGNWILGDVGEPTPVDEAEMQVLQGLIAAQPVRACVSIGPGALRRSVGNTVPTQRAEYFFACGNNPNALWYAISADLTLTPCDEPQCKEMWLTPYF